MPRKNARPAARKAAALLKAKMAEKAKPQRRVGIIAHHHPSGAGLALFLAAALRRIDPRS